MTTKNNLRAALAVGALVFASCGQGTAVSSQSPQSEQGESGLALNTPTTEPRATPTTTSPTTEQPIEPPAVSTSTSGVVCSISSDPVGFVDVGTTWVEGQSVEITREMRRDRPGAPLVRGFTDAIITVDSTDAQGTSLQWEWGETTFPDVSEEEAAAAEQAIAAFAPPVLHYRIDNDGYFSAIENIADLRQFVRNATIDFAEISGDVDDSVTALLDVYDAMSDQEFSAAFAQEILLFHALDGETFELGEVQTTMVEIPNAFGGRPFPATSTLSFDIVDGDGCAAISEVTKPEPSAFVGILFESLSDVFGEPLDDDEEVLDELRRNFTLQNEIHVQVDIETGAVQSVAARQESTIQGEVAVEEEILTVTN